MVAKLLGYLIGVLRVLMDIAEVLHKKITKVEQVRYSDWAEKELKDKRLEIVVKEVNKERVWLQRTVLVASLIEARFSFIRLITAMVFLGLASIWRIMASYEIAEKKLKDVCKTGVYLLVRHPLYVGSILSTYSLVIAFGGPMTIIVFLVHLFSYVKSIVVEEIALIRRFNQKYVEFRKTVRRAIFPDKFIPNFSLRSLKEGFFRNKEWFNFVVALFSVGLVLLSLRLRGKI